MVSRPNSMEALKVMTDYLDEASDKEKSLEMIIYYSSAAICSGLMAVVYELRSLKAEDLKKAA